eukprot:1138351-Pelagomonas_calceolata.AAC.5
MITAAILHSYRLVQGCRTSVSPFHPSTGLVAGIVLIQLSCPCRRVHCMTLSLLTTLHWPPQNVLPRCYTTKVCVHALNGLCSLNGILVRKLALRMACLTAHSVLSGVAGFETQCLKPQACYSFVLKHARRPNLILKKGEQEGECRP